MTSFQVMNLIIFLKQFFQFLFAIWFLFERYFQEFPLRFSTEMSMAIPAKLIYCVQVWKRTCSICVYHGTATHEKALLTAWKAFGRVFKGNSDVMVAECGGCFWGPRDLSETLSMACKEGLHGIDIYVVILTRNFFFESPNYRRNFSFGYSVPVNAPG